MIGILKSGIHPGEIYSFSEYIPLHLLQPEATHLNMYRMYGEVIAGPVTLYAYISSVWKVKLSNIAGFAILPVRNE
jgi:hypothetical protein